MSKIHIGFVAHDTHQSSTTLDTDSNGDVGELDVVQDKGARKTSVLSSAVLDENGGVRDNSVDDGFSADTLRAGVGCAAALGDSEADLAVVYRDALEGPSPVPQGKYLYTVRL